MVIVTHSPQDMGGSSSGGKAEYKRLMRVEGDSLVEIMNSKLIPMDNSRHPDDSRYILKSRDFQIVGNLNRRVQCQVELSYEKGTFSGWGNFDEDTGNQDPWKMGAFDISVSPVSENVPFVVGYNSSGQSKNVVNSAGCRIVSETQRYNTQISFTYCVDAKTFPVPPLNLEPVINAHTEKVAGFTFAPFCALLQPMSATLIVEYNNEGDISRQYWQISATIIYNWQTHAKKILNIGTMARFNGDSMPRPIYQYTPWDSTKNEENIRKRPVFGSIDDVILAKQRYANLFPTSQYKQRFDELPYHEMTEPVPLMANGSVDVGALTGLNPYETKSYFETKPRSWKSLNFPEDRA